jgi:hypothetical protein
MWICALYIYVHVYSFVSKQEFFTGVVKFLSYFLCITKNEKIKFCLICLAFQLERVIFKLESNVGNWIMITATNKKVSLQIFIASLPYLWMHKN